jgi:transcriptional regulator with XRE-family HTH domain
MSKTKPTRQPKRFAELRKPIESDPVRNARVEEHKTAMLGELRRKLDLTQAVVADRLDVTQENVSQLERGEADVRLSTLSRYVQALGGHLEVRAAFPEETVTLSVGNAAKVMRRRSSENSTTAKTSNRSKATLASKKPRRAAP